VPDPNGDLVVVSWGHLQRLRDRVDHLADRCQVEVLGRAVAERQLAQLLEVTDAGDD
jgi:hypothetical protein